MKRKVLSVLLPCLLLIGVILPVGAADEASALFGKINVSRRDAGKPDLTREVGLDAIAADYAGILCDAGSGFRKSTDFKTLPDGGKVITLAKKHGVAVSGFSYSVFFGADAKPEATNEYRTKAVNGAFTRVGIACVSGKDSSCVTVIVYDSSAVTSSAEDRLYDYSALYNKRNTSDAGEVIKHLQIPLSFEGVTHSLDQGRLVVSLPLLFGPGEVYTMQRTPEIQDYILLFALFEDIRVIEFVYTQADYGSGAPVTREQADEIFGDEIARYGASWELFTGAFADRIEALIYTPEIKSTVSYDEDVMYMGEPEDTPPIYRGFPLDGEIDTGDLAALDGMLIEPLYPANGLWLYSWNTPREIEPDDLILSCSMNNYLGLPWNRETEAKYPDPNASAEEVERMLYRRFGVTAAHLEQSTFYDAEGGTYLMVVGGGGWDATIIDAKREGDLLTLEIGIRHFISEEWPMEDNDIRLEGMPENEVVSPQGILTVELADDHFKIISYMLHAADSTKE